MYVTAYNLLLRNCSCLSPPIHWHLFAFSHAHCRLVCLFVCVYVCLSAHQLCSFALLMLLAVSLPTGLNGSGMVD